MKSPSVVFLAFLLLSLFPSLFLGLAPGPAAWAAGGAQIVDDSEVVDPGTCQLETWVTGFDTVGGGGYANATNTCTLSSLPRLEFGLQFQHYWYAGILGSDQLLGPALKVNLIPEATGVGLGLAFSGGVNMATGEFELGQLIMPVSIPLNDKTRINLNAGWSYFRFAEIQNALFYGAQIESKVGWEEVSLMLEVFGRQPGFTGVQMGLRWRPNDGPLEFDLLAGSFLDTVNAKFFTVGITFRY
ncbi:MAG: hypothetical protein Q8K93_11430 [Reyranella sp.]|nr:hypothetical protein [Reyranella sp.]